MIYHAAWTIQHHLRTAEHGSRYDIDGKIIFVQKNEWVYRSVKYLHILRLMVTDHRREHAQSRLERENHRRSA